MTTTYAVVRRPGFRDHEMRILSAHHTPEAAIKAAAKHDHLDARGYTVSPCHAVNVPSGCRKGGTLWDDTCGRTGWESI